MEAGYHYGNIMFNFIKKKKNLPILQNLPRFQFFQLHLFLAHSYYTIKAFPCFANVSEVRMLCEILMLVIYSRIILVYSTIKQIAYKGKQL